MAGISQGMRVPPRSSALLRVDLGAEFSNDESSQKSVRSKQPIVYSSEIVTAAYEPPAKGLCPVSGHDDAASVADAATLTVPWTPSQPRE